jgi:hypothetical protein
MVRAGQERQHSTWQMADGRWPMALSRFCIGFYIEVSRLVALVVYRRHPFPQSAGPRHSSSAGGADPSSLGMSASSSGPPMRILALCPLRRLESSIYALSTIEGRRKLDGCASIRTQLPSGIFKLVDQVEARYRTSKLVHVLAICDVAID